MFSFLGVRLCVLLGGWGDRLEQLSCVSGVVPSEYVAHRIQMFRPASAPAVSNSGPAADATTLPNPSKISSDSFLSTIYYSCETKLHKYSQHLNVHVSCVDRCHVYTLFVTNLLRALRLTLFPFRSSPVSCA